MPNAIWDIWYVLSLLILITTLEGRYCYHSHFTEHGNLMRSQIQEVWELRFQPGSLPTPDPMPSTPLASGWQASGQSWSPLQAWDLVLLESVYLCNVNSTCGHWGHHVPVCWWKLPRHTGSYKHFNWTKGCLYCRDSSLSIKEIFSCS